MLQMYTLWVDTLMEKSWHKVYATDVVIIYIWMEMSSLLKIHIQVYFEPHDSPPPPILTPTFYT